MSNELINPEPILGVLPPGAKLKFAALYILLYSWICTHAMVEFRNKQVYHENQKLNAIIYCKFSIYGKKIPRVFK